jgi:hypothetical protein
VTANAVSDSEIDLSWAPSTDNVGVAGYQIDKNGILIATTTNLSFQNTDLSAGTQYTYYLTAFDLAGNVSATSTSVSATTQSTPSGGGGGSSGGGGGGGGGYYEPPVTATATSMTMPQMESLLTSLEAELNALEAQAGISTSFTFTHNLSLGMRGADVQALQHYLNTHGFPVVTTPTYAGSLGYETKYFGVATEKALSLFQMSVGIKPDSGYFGPITRAWANGHE